MAMALSVTPISSDCTDADLVAAVRRGSDAAFEELYARYSQRIGAYVRGMVGDHGRAEDVTQEIFIAALRRMRDTERPIAFKPWIYEIARNACIDSYRRTRRAQEVSLDADDGLSPADRGRLTVITTPDSALDSKQAIEHLRGAFGGLSEAHHEILVLRELEGLSYNDIGERLGMSRPVVESTLFRARRRLAEEYDELASGRRCIFVHKMVDSGPHYSLGIRDRRRIGRHLAHCQSCRAYARAGGFDTGSLKLPSLRVGAAAVLPLGLLQLPLSGLRGLGQARPRSSLWAWRSLHTLARTSDALAAMPSAGRGAATAAAIVLAGVGGGVATVASQSGAAPTSSAAAMTPAAIVGAPFARTEANEMLSTRPSISWLNAGRWWTAPAGPVRIASKRAPGPGSTPRPSRGAASSTSGPGSGAADGGSAGGSAASPTGTAAGGSPAGTLAGGADNSTPGGDAGSGDGSGSGSQAGSKGSGSGTTGRPPTRPGGGSGTNRPTGTTTPTGTGSQNSGTTTSTDGQPPTPAPTTPTVPNAGNSGHPPMGAANGVARGLTGTQKGQAQSPASAG